jgi:hypothetical protein
MTVCATLASVATAPRAVTPLAGREADRVCGTDKAMPSIPSAKGARASALWSTGSATRLAAEAGAFAMVMKVLLSARAKRFSVVVS